MESTFTSQFYTSPRKLLALLNRASTRFTTASYTPSRSPLREVEGIENDCIKSTAVRLVDFIKDGQDFSSLDFFIWSFAELDYRNGFMLLSDQQRLRKPINICINDTFAKIDPIPVSLN